MATIDTKLRRREVTRHFDASPERIQNGRCRMSYQIIVWSALVWVAICRCAIRVRAQRPDHMALKPAYPVAGRSPSHRRFCNDLHPHGHAGGPMAVTSLGLFLGQWFSFQLLKPIRIYDRPYLFHIEMGPDFLPECAHQRLVLVRTIW